MAQGKGTTVNPDNFFVSTDDAYLNVPWVVLQIKGAYWGGWRSPELIERSLKNSLCFGLYFRDAGEPGTGPGRNVQVGFARVVGDETTVSWICDVVIDERYQHSGLGRFLMDALLAHPAVAKTVCILRTRDRHEFYRKFGFEMVDSMRRIPK